MILIDHFITDYVHAMREDASAFNSTVRSLKQYGELPKGQNQRLEIGITEIAKVIIASSIPNLSGKALSDKAIHLFNLRISDLPDLTDSTPDDFARLHSETPVSMLEKILIRLWTYDPSNAESEQRRRDARQLAMVVNHTRTTISFNLVGLASNGQVQMDRLFTFALPNPPGKFFSPPKENATTIYLRHVEFMGRDDGRPYWEIFGEK